MSVGSFTVRYYICKCDACGKVETVEGSEAIYKAAQAVRSLGWSYGKDRSVKCHECRMHEYGDNYKWVRKK